MACFVVGQQGGRYHASHGLRFGARSAPWVMAAHLQAGTEPTGERQHLGACRVCAPWWQQLTCRQALHCESNMLPFDILAGSSCLWPAACPIPGRRQMAVRCCTVALAGGKPREAVTQRGFNDSGGGC